MVAENGVDAHRSIEAAQGADEWLHLVGAAVHDVAGEYYNIRVERVDAVHKVRDERRVGAECAGMEV